jgi:Cyclin, N-terminal domain
MDAHISRNRVTPENIKLVAVVCLMLASKSEDFSTHFITIPLAAIKTESEQVAVRQNEVEILNSLNWELDLLTPSEVCIGLQKLFLSNHLGIEFQSKLCNYAWEFGLSVLHIKESVQGSLVEFGTAIAIATFDILDPTKVELFVNWLYEFHCFDWVNVSLSRLL